MRGAEGCWLLAELTWRSLRKKTMTNVNIKSLQSRQALLVIWKIILRKIEQTSDTRGEGRGVWALGRSEVDTDKIWHDLVQLECER